MTAAGPSSERAPETIPGNGGTTAWVQRVSGILEVAAQVGTGVPLDELATLLPPEAPANGQEMAAWLAQRPELARLEANRAFAPRAASSREDPSRRRRRREYLAAAEELKNSTFRPVLPLLLTLGVTRSAAYGEPEAGDDLDLLVITRKGSLWVFLAYAYLSLRRGKGPRVGGERAVVCLNYARDSDEAFDDFSLPQDFLFAREALTTRVLHGERYYAALLSKASWMGREVPRLYAERRGEEAIDRPPAAPWTLRLVNLVIFPLLAAYLQAQGLRRNARSRERGEEDDTFRTDTRLGSVSFVSRRFERRRQGYRAVHLVSVAAPRSTLDPPVASAGPAATPGG